MGEAWMEFAAGALLATRILSVIVCYFAVCDVRWYSWNLQTCHIRRYTSHWAKHVLASGYSSDSTAGLVI